MEDERVMKQELWDKLYKEYDEYTDYLEKQDVNYIIERSYETAIKSEIVDIFDPEICKYDKDTIKALLSLDNPLSSLYDIWINCDGDILELIYDNTYPEIQKLKEDYLNKSLKNIDKER